MEENKRIIICLILILLIASFTYPFIVSEAIPIKSDGLNAYSICGTSHTRQTDDGGLITIGFTEEGPYLIKTNAYGTMQWKTTWGWQYEFNDVQQTSDGGYIICGIWNNEEGLLMKTTPQGDASWENHYWVSGMGLYFKLNSVQQTSEGGFVAGGLRAKAPEEIAEGLVVKTDPSGNDEWIKTEAESINCIQQTSDGGYISVGVFDVWPPESDHIYYVGLCKRDSTGNIEWDVELSKTGSATYVQQIEDGGYLITCGGFANLVKTNSVGKIEWRKLNEYMRIK